MMDSTYTKTTTTTNSVRNGETAPATTVVKHKITLKLSEPEMYMDIEALARVMDEAKWYYAPDSAVIETIDDDEPYKDPSMDVMITGYVITWTTED